MEILEVRETWVAAMETTQIEVVEVGTIPVSSSGVRSVNGRTGDVIVDAEDILEWSTNEW